MNKELMQGMSIIVRDNMWYDCDTEEMGITPDGLQEIISLCADEAIDAVNEKYGDMKFIANEYGLMSVISSIDAIENRMKQPSDNNQGEK